MADETPDYELKVPAAGFIPQRPHDDTDEDFNGDSGPSAFADPACPACHGTGFPAASQGRSEMCPCVATGRRRAAADARIKLLFGQGGAKMTIATYDHGDIEGNQLALACARNYVLNWPAFNEAGAGFALQGEPGCGKTHLSTGVLIALIKRYDVKPFCLSVPELLRLARKKFNDPDTEDVLDRAMNADIYLLDDIGAEYHRGGQDGMSWVDEQLFLILNHRLNNGLPTLYTTNLSKRELQGRLDDRVARRLDTATVSFLPVAKVARAVAKPSGLKNLLMHGS